MTAVLASAIYTRVKCPLTGELFVEPVTAEDGFTYEKTAIVKHFTKSHLSPVTFEEIGKQLVPSHVIRHVANHFRSTPDQDGFLFKKPKVSTKKVKKVKNSEEPSEEKYEKKPKDPLEKKSKKTDTIPKKKKVKESDDDVSQKQIKKAKEKEPLEKGKVPKKKRPTSDDLADESPKKVPKKKKQADTEEESRKEISSKKKMKLSNDD